VVVFRQRNAAQIATHSRESAPPRNPKPPLKRQELHLTDLTRRAFIALATATQLTALTHLSVGPCDVRRGSIYDGDDEEEGEDEEAGSTSVHPLSVAPWLTNLRSLRLECDRFGWGSIVCPSAILGGLTLPHLATLVIAHLRDNGNDPPHLSGLATASLPGLKVLQLSRCCISAGAIANLVKSTWISSLETLKLQTVCPFMNNPMAVLCVAPLRSLRALYVHGPAELVVGSIAKAAGQPSHWVATSLTSLRLGPRIEWDAGAAAPWVALSTAPLRALRALDLSGINMPPDAAAAIGKAPWLSGLDELRVLAPCYPSGSPRLDPVWDALGASLAFVKLQRDGKVQCV